MFAPEFTAAQVAQAFQRDAPSLFLGAAFVAVGLVAAAFSVIRRKADPVLIYFALFAGLYGSRLWIKADLFSLSAQNWWFFPRLRSSVDFLIPIPAFLFFNAAGLLQRKAKIAGYVLGVAMTFLAVATLVIGPRGIFYQVNNVLVIAALVILTVRSVRRDADDEDFIIARRGLLIFAAFAFWENLRNLLNLSLPNIEAVGFAAFLIALGYVAARQTVRRDQQLGEIQKELEIAKKIQLSILPAAFPASANFQVAAQYVPMTSVAGDFYDFIVAEDKRAGLLIADVSGHGVPAALIASMVKLAATSQRSNSTDPSGLLAGMNVALCGNTQNQFVTAAYVHLDSELRELRYSAAGHPPMLLLRGGKVRQIEENGLMLAAFDFATYSTAAHALEPGDRLLLYTDGVVEASNGAGEFLGQATLENLLRDSSGLSVHDAAGRIIAAVQKWAVSQDDDLTVLICDYVGHS